MLPSVVDNDLLRGNDSTLEFRNIGSTDPMFVCTVSVKNNKSRSSLLCEANDPTKVARTHADLEPLLAIRHKSFRHHYFIAAAVQGCSLPCRDAPSLS